MTEMTRMFSLTPGDARPQAAEAADDQVNLHARLRGAVERPANGALLERVALDDDLRRPAGLGVLGLALDHREEPVAHAQRRDEQLAVLALAATAP